MATKKKQNGPLFALTGSFDYMRDRELRHLIDSHSNKGFTIRYVDGSDMENLLAALSPNFLFDDDGDKTLLIVENPDKADLGVLKNHSVNYDSDIVAMLYLKGNPRGNTKFGKFVKGLGGSHKNFPTPESWNMDKIAIETCAKDAKKMFGKTVSHDTATVLVASVGNDLGFLSFELMKAAVIADIEDSNEITTTHLKKSVAALTEMDIIPVVDCLVHKDPVKLAQTLARVKKNSKKDPTIAVAAFVGNAAVRWLGVTDQKNKKIPLDQAADNLKMNRCFYKIIVFPQAYKWTRSEVIHLIQAVAYSRRAVLSGQINPWVVLCSRLLELCR